MTAPPLHSRSCEWLEPYGIARFGPGALPLTIAVLAVTAGVCAADRFHVRAVPHGAVVAWCAVAFAYFAGLICARRRVRFDASGFVVRGLGGWGIPRTIARAECSHVRIARWYVARLFVVHVYANRNPARAARRILRLSLFSIGPPLALAEILARNGIAVEIPDRDLAPRRGDRRGAYVVEAVIACLLVLAGGLIYEFARPGAHLPGQ